MTFKQLPIGAIFEFDHTDMDSCLALTHGPWRKTTARKYVQAEGIEACDYQVGTTKIRVTQGTECHGLPKRQGNLT